MRKEKKNCKKEKENKVSRARDALGWVIIQSSNPYGSIVIFIRIYIKVFCNVGNGTWMT